MIPFTCGFIGLGLIGGSIAKALRTSDASVHIMAYDINQESLLLAKKEGVIDEVCTSITPSFGDCDFIFLCAPVSKNDENISKIGQFIHPDCILTDVGSVKSTIHDAIREHQLEDNFIGGHPMAGSEKTGYSNANPLLLENAYYILTPTPSVSPDKVEKYRILVSSMGALPIIMDYHKHDYITSVVSHIPHIIASSLVNLVHDTDEDGLMRMIAAGGFKDITRIASSSPGMWQQICFSNKDNISRVLTSYIASLEQIRKDLEDNSGEEIYQLFADAKDYRDSFINAASGPLKKVYDIYLDLPDEAGAIAKTAAILAQNAISIKNIGIMHNREFQEGVLRIEFYDESATKEASLLLKNNNYTIYERN